jgi:hypothetical protein
MPTPSSGAISFSDIAWIVYNNYSTQVSLNDSDVRALLGISSGTIGMNSAYSKPTAGNTGGSYYAPGSYSWAVVPYKTLYAQVAGGGGGGGGGCGGQFFTYGCVNFCASSAGTAGAQTSFNGVVSNGGGGGANCGGAAGANGGNNQNGNTGGGGSSGAGGIPGGVNCSVSNGAAGGRGGFVEISWTKAVNGPAYGATLNFSVGGGGVGIADGCRAAPGGAGGSGWVYIAWS